MTSNNYCCVPGCNSWRKKHPERTFHRFPRKGVNRVYVESISGRELVDRHKVWVHKLKIGKPISPYMLVCCLHFKDDDFMLDCKQKRRILKKNAVPSQKLPKSSVETTGASTSSAAKARHARQEERNKIKSILTKTTEDEQSVPRCSIHLQEIAAEFYNEEELAAADSLVKMLDIPVRANVATFKDFEVQVNTLQLQTISSFINTDKSLCTFTGIQSFGVLNHIVFSVESFYKDKKLHKLDVKERILLTFMKFKLNISNAILSIFFKISNTLCHTYLVEMIVILAKALNHAIYWPDKEEISHNIPLCFMKFKDTQVVLDCTEICVQQPKCLCCRIKFYSRYKGNHTVKFMTGVSPAGLITFVSVAFGGRASDKTIFNHSNIIDLIQPKMAVMVDKGFLIDDVCNSRQVKIYRPPFLRDRIGNQLSKEDAAFNKSIAAARVHIERANQRLKIFKILGGTLNWNFVPYVDEILKIICAVTNLSSPILGEDKFVK